VTDGANKLQPGIVFTGDTLFIGGCGRFFEGTAADMDAALNYLATLPDNTIVFNGHEYTSGNVAFAKSVDPENKAIARLEDIVKQNKVTTGLTTIGDEKEWNVFMRLDNDSIRHGYHVLYLGPTLMSPLRKVTTGATSTTSRSTIMATLRKQKDDFKG
jgi:hydroxyacylglutathione hydrolase